MMALKTLAIAPVTTWGHIIPCKTTAQPGISAASENAVGCCDVRVIFFYLILKIPPFQLVHKSSLREEEESVSLCSRSSKNVLVIWTKLTGRAGMKIFTYSWVRLHTRTQNTRVWKNKYVTWVTIKWCIETKESLFSILNGKEKLQVLPFNTFHSNIQNFGLSEYICALVRSLGCINGDGTTQNKTKQLT